MTRHRRAGSRWRVKLVRMRKGPMDGSTVNVFSHPPRLPASFTPDMRDSHDDIAAEFAADLVLADTEMDEVVIGRAIHIEAMGAGQYWMSIAGIVVNLSMDRDGNPTSAMLYPAGSYDVQRAGCRYWVDDREDTESPSEESPDHDETLIVCMPGRMSGRPTIGHSRLPVATVMSYIELGCSKDTVQASWPSVTDEQYQVLEALAADLQLAQRPLPPDPEED